MMIEIVPILFGMACLLVLVSLLPLAALRFNLPLTVLLAAVGVLLGGALRLLAGGSEPGPVEELVRPLSEFHLSAEGFFYIFLPILLAEMALALDIRRLLDDIAPIMLLAVVAVVMSTLVVGAALAAIAPVVPVACFLLAAIVATTDPGAVISIFRDLGAPRRLCALVEGESLLNDAAAVALFVLLLDQLAGYRTSTGVGAVVIDFLCNFGGGALLGFLMGRVACQLIGWLRNQPLAEISLTVAFAYLSYIVADHFVGVSGVVSVVMTALVLGSFGRTRISPKTWSALVHVWHQLGFWANSLIFLLAAMMVPESLEEATWTEGGLLLVMVLAALAARGLVLFGLMPVLLRLGLARRISPAYKLVILWGGLRGAVSLVLALGAAESPHVSADEAHFIRVLATGFVLFTLFVNGTTLRLLIRLLGLDRLPPVDLAVRNRVRLLSLASIRDEMTAAAKAYQIKPEVGAKIAAQYDQRVRTIEQAVAEEPPLTDDERLTIGLVILINREEELYFQHFENGIISRRVVEVLTTRTGWLMEGARDGGLAGYEEAAKRGIGFTSRMRWSVRLHRRFGIRGPLERRLATRWESVVIVRKVLAEMENFNRERLTPILGEAVVETLAQLLQRRIAAVDQAQAALRIQYPDVARVLQHQYLGRVALRMEEADYAVMFEESLINQDIYTDLARDVDRRRLLLEQPPVLNLGLKIDDLVGRLPLLAGLPPQRLQAVARLLKPRFALPGEYLVRRGEHGDAMYFIASGQVAVVVAGKAEALKLDAGSFFGELALLSHQPRSADVHAVGYCHLLELDARDFRRLLDEDEHLRQHILSIAEARDAGDTGRTQPAAETTGAG